AGLPAFRTGDTVAFTVICRCAGRQVPSVHEAEQLTSSFRVVDADAASTEALRHALLHEVPARALSAATRLAGTTSDAGSPSASNASPSIPSASPQPHPLSLVRLPEGNDTCPPSTPTGPFVVKGLVKANGAPLVCARVQVYDKDLRTEQLLGEAITNT